MKESRCHPNKIALGTAQLGLRYGIANQVGNVNINTAKQILQYAQLTGVDTLDTAIAYGDSEQRLGEIGVSSWNVISKLPEIPVRDSDILPWVEQSVLGSIHRLKISRLYGLLLHHPQQLLSSDGKRIYEVLNLLKAKKIVDKIGISIYSHTELDALCPYFDFDLVQAPFSILDQSLDQSGWLNDLKQLGIEIHVRSVFLQGLLLMNSSSRPSYFNKWKSIWEIWERWLAEEKLTPLQACLGFVLSKPNIDRVVVGVESLQQIQEILSVTTKKYSSPPSNLCCDDPRLVNPNQWKLT